MPKELLIKFATDEQREMFYKWLHAEGEDALMDHSIVMANTPEEKIRKSEYDAQNHIINFS